MARLKFDRTQIETFLSKTPDEKAEIFLVKDDGIYLMSGGESRPATVAYARGFNPKTDGEEVWQNCADAVGGDDFGEPVGTKAEFVKILADSRGDIIVNVSETTLSVSYLPKTATPVVKPWKRYDVYKGATTGKWRVVDDPAAKKSFPYLFPTKAAAQKWARGRKALALPISAEAA